MDEITDQFTACWFSAADPYYGYLKIFPYSHEYNGGDAIAMPHAGRGDTTPLTWYKGTWKPTSMGYEVIAGPYHWKNIALFNEPETPNAPLFKRFTSNLNGWGGCNLGILPGGDEKELLDSLEGLPEWQEALTYWAPYPSASFEQSREYYSHSGRLEQRDKRKKKMAKQGITTPEQGAPVLPTANGDVPKKQGGDGKDEQTPANEEGSGKGDGGNGGNGGDSGNGGGESGGKPSGGDDAGKADSASGGGKQQQSAQTKNTDSGKSNDSSSNGKGKDDSGKKSGGGLDKDGDGNVADDIVTGRFLRKNKDEDE